MRNVFLYIAGVILFSAMAWYAFVGFKKPQAHSTQKATTATTIDAFITDFSVTQYQKDGRKHYHLASPEALHYAQDRTTEITQPKLRLYGTNDWSAQSQTAVLLADHSTLEMKKDVMLKKLNTKTPNLIMTTQALTLNTKNHTAHTPLPVTIKQGRQMMRSVGLLADYQQQNVTLQSKVTSTYDSH